MNVLPFSAQSLGARSSKMVQAGSLTASDFTNVQPYARAQLS